MVVDQAGNDRLVIQLDELRPLAHMRADFIIGTNREDAPILDGQGLVHRKIPVDSENAATEQHGIRPCSLAALYHGECREHQQRCDDLSKRHA